jgi:bifunctional non-homologous end joining protein LigD
MQPMLATLTERRFSDPEWIFETKFDGIRLIGVKHGADVRLYSRTKQDLSGRFPGVAKALGRHDGPDFVIDGEVVAFEGNRTSFARLQQSMRRRVAIFYYVFDVMQVEGYDVTELALRDRKRVLQRLLTFQDPLRWAAHRNADGQRVYREACRKGLEGVIAKRADSPYVHGRSPNWLKFKCVNEQEFVVGGFTDPKGSRKGFGALLIGYYEGGALRYAGKVGQVSTTTCWIGSRRRCGPPSGPTPRSGAGRCRGRMRTGWSPSSSRKSDSPSGPGTGRSAIRDSSDFVPTSGPRRWCANGRPEQGSSGGAGGRC